MTIPADVIKILETKLDGMEYGHCSLDVFVRSGKPRYEVTQKTSIHEGTLLKGVDENCLKCGHNKNMSS